VSSLAGEVAVVTGARHGIGAALAAALAAAGASVAVTHHDGAVASQVAAHLLGSIPHGAYLEVFLPERDPIWWNLVANRPPLEEGWIELTDAPGLGWELDPEYVARYRLR